MNRARRDDPDAWKRGYVDEETGEVVFPARPPSEPKREPPQPSKPTFSAFLDERREVATRTRAAMGRRVGACLLVGAACVPCFAVPGAFWLAFVAFIVSGVVGWFAAFEWVMANRELTILP